MHLKSQKKATQFTSGGFESHGKLYSRLKQNNRFCHNSIGSGHLYEVGTRRQVIPEHGSLMLIWKCTLQ